MHGRVKRAVVSEGLDSPAIDVPRGKPPQIVESEHMKFNIYIYMEYIYLYIYIYMVLFQACILTVLLEGHANLLCIVPASKLTRHP